MAATGSLALPSCAKVLGVDEGSHSDAVAEICSCPVGEAAAAGDCVARVTKRLEAAGPQVSAEWLKAYADRGCTTCDVAALCFYSAPACTTGECVTTEECCGFATKSQRCDVPAGQPTGTCASCTPVGQRCLDKSECCGASDEVECVGASDGSKGFCVENCFPEQPDNCPGCCLHYTAPGGGGDLCADQVVKGECPSRCDSLKDVESCSDSTHCTSLFEASVPGALVKAHIYGCK